MLETRGHITCQEVVELVTEYLEQSLPAPEAALFEQHLNFCDGCVSYLDQLRLIVAAAHRVRETDIPPEARTKLMEAFRDWKRS